jgi:hypothetical protein
MKKIPPFVKNDADDTHCVPAVFRMVHQFYFNEDISFKKLDVLMYVVPGKGIWSTPAEIYLIKKGLKLKIIIDTNYRQLMKEGADYFKRTLGKDTSDYYIHKSNLVNILHLLPEYTKLINQERRRATVKDIEVALKKGQLVAAQVDSRRLNNKAGFSLHFVLLYDFSEGFFTLHDPGLPPVKSRRVSKENFNKAFSYKGAEPGIIIFDKS